jgi:hypothetical protein
MRRPSYLMADIRWLRRCKKVDALARRIRDWEIERMAAADRLAAASVPAPQQRSEAERRAERRWEHACWKAARKRIVKRRRKKTPA